MTRRTVTATLMRELSGREAARFRTQNAFVESFNGRLRDELLNETLFTSLGHARQELTNWRVDYNQERPHSSIGNLPPAAYAKLSAPSTQRDGALRYTGGSALPPRCITEPSELN